MNSVLLDGLWMHCRGFSSLKTLIEAFSSPTAVDCHEFVVPYSGLTSGHVYHLILFITQARFLRTIDISGNLELHEALPLLFSAARNVKTIFFQIS